MGKRTISVRQERYLVPCGSRYCPACGERWAKDQRVRAVAAAKALGGDAALITVTGPGRHRFRSTSRVAGADPSHVIRWWNRTARERWSSLHRRALTATTRAIGKPPAGWCVQYRVWEYQKRGVLHNHLVLPGATEAEKEWTERYVSEVWARARSFDFGFVLGGGRDDEPGWDRPPPVVWVDPNAVACYVSKYVSKAGGGKDGLVFTARRTAMRGSVLYIAPRLLAESGVSMTTLRARRRIVGRYPWAVTSRRAWQEATIVDAVQSGHPPLTQQAVDALRGALWGVVPGVIIRAAHAGWTAPTRAPEPLGLPGHDPWPEDQGREWVVGLASVLLHVPEPEELGWTRCEISKIDTRGTREAPETYELATV